MPETPLSTLTRVRALLATPERWAQSWYAYTADGQRTSSLNPLACRWCLRGAIARVCEAEGAQISQIAAVTELAATLRVSPDGLPSAEVMRFNDVHSHAEVLTLLDQTIERLSR